MTQPVLGFAINKARDLAHRYAAAIDDGDVDTAVGLFAPDADLLLPEPPHHLEPIHHHHGRDAIRTALSSVFSVGATLHEITGQVVDVTSVEANGLDRATGRITCAAHHYIGGETGETTDLVWRIRYDDDYIQERGEWLIAARSLTVLAIEKHPVRAVLPRGGIRLLP